MRADRSESPESLAPKAVPAKDFIGRPVVVEGQRDVAHRYGELHGGTFLGATEQIQGYRPGAVCGKEMFNGKEIPVCKSCTTHPEIGCPCTNEEQCGGELTCWGGPNTGFASARPGTCLPKDTVALQKLPWFCLDNCAAINSYGAQGAACVYHQVTNLEFSHGTCVNFATACGKELPGQCEQSEKVCRVDLANNDVCVAECKTKADCANHGFPDTYECDAPRQPRRGERPLRCARLRQQHLRLLQAVPLTPRVHRGACGRRRAVVKSSVHAACAVEGSPAV